MSDVQASGGLPSENEPVTSGAVVARNSALMATGTIFHPILQAR